MSAPVPVPVMFDGTDLLESRACAVPDPAVFDGAVLTESRAAAGPATPDRDLDRTIAHLLLTCEVNAGHLHRHAAAAQGASTPDSLVHNLRHAVNHTTVISEHQEKLRQALIRRVPAIGREMDQLNQVSGTRAGTGPGQAPKAGPDLDRGLGHDLASAMAATGHVYRHLAEAQLAPDPVSSAFNLAHAITHAGEITHYHQGLQDGLTRRLPAVGPELDKLRGLAGMNGPPTIPVIPLASRSRGFTEDDYDITPPDHGPQPA